MAEQNEIKQAKVAYATLCAMLDEDEQYYEKDEEKFTIYCSAKGDDLPMPIRIEVEPDRQIIILLSSLPFTVPEDRRAEMAIAVTRANDLILNGSFDYDFINGYICFRLATSFRDSLVSKELFKYMIGVSLGTVDNFNDKFETVSNSKMDVKEIMEFIKWED